MCYTLSVILVDFTVWRYTWQAIAQASELSFPVVFHTENCAVHSGNPTISSVYLPTPRWYHLKTHPFLTIHSADEHRMIYSFSNTTSYAIFYAFFSDNITADVVSKQQTTALLLSTIVTRTRRHTELTKKNQQTSWETCAVPENIQFETVWNQEHSVQFFVQFFYTVKLHGLT